MAFPVIATTATTGGNNAGTTPAHNLPASIASGDLLIMVVTCKTGTSQLISFPGGWTKFANFTTGGAETMAAGWRIADGTEGATITVTLAVSVKSASVCYRITGHDAANAPSGSAVGTLDPPANTPSGGTKSYLWIATVGNITNDTAYTGDPTNYTNPLDVANTGGSTSTRCRIRSVSRQLSASTENPAAFTGGGTTERASTIAVFPSTNTDLSGGAVAGSYAVSGVDARTIKDTVAASAGSYAVTGAAATTVPPPKISNPTVVTADVNLNNGNPYTTALVTLLAGRRYYLMTWGYTGTAPTVSSVVHDAAGTPLNFAVASDGTHNAKVDTYDSARSMEVWTVKPNADTANAIITITWNTTISACGWILLEVASGVDGTTPIPQIVTATGTATTSASVTMASYSSADALVLLFVAIGTGVGDPADNIVPAEGRVELSDLDDGERQEGAAHYANPNGADTSLTASWTGTLDYGAIGIELKAAAPTTLLTATAGSYAVSGSTARTIKDTVAAAPGSYAVTGFDMVMERGKILDASADSYVVTGADATTLRALIESASAGAYAVAGADAVTLRDLIENASAGSYAVAGADATTTVGASPNTDLLGDALPGAYAVTGADVTLLRTLIESATAGSYAVSGAALTTLRDLIENTGVGAYAASGFAATTVRDLIESATAGAYAVSGFAVTTVRALLESAAVGAYALTGAAIATGRALLESAGVGAYALTGAALTSLWDQLESAGSGAYVLTGFVADTVVPGQEVALAGSYTIAGANATTLRTLLLTATSGSYIVTGVDGILGAGRVLAGDAVPGAYVVVGMDAADSIAYYVQGDPGAYVVTGFDGLTGGGGKELLGGAEVGSYTITGAVIADTVGHLMVATSGGYSITGVNAVTGTPFDVRFQWGLNVTLRKQIAIGE